jgi:predicted transcriptional regulator
MKTIYAPGGLPTFVTLHENRVYEDLVEQVCRDDLSEREIYLLQSLVNKNLVKRIVENKKVYYRRTKGSM